MPVTDQEKAAKARDAPIGVSLRIDGDLLFCYANTYNLVRHVHAHEQRRELVECDAEHGCTPIELLGERLIPVAASF